MIHLEHLNLVVADLDRSLAFYRAAFPHWHIRAKGGGDWYGKPRTWVHFGDDYQYLALSDFGEGPNRDLVAGFAVDNPGAQEPWRRNVYFIDPDGFEVEFVQYLSDLPAQRNAAPEEVLSAAAAMDQAA